MRVAVEEIRTEGAQRPRPDPLPRRAASPWRRHGPWLLTAAASGTALTLLDARAIGLLACGAGGLGVLAGAAQGGLRKTCRAMHHAAGVLALALLRSPEEAASFAAPAAVLLVAALFARAMALRVRPQVAPLAGRVPWRFAAAYRGMALRFGLVGLAAGLLLALAGPSTPLKVLAVAMLPLALRSYVGTLLSRRAARAAWSVAVLLHVAVLAVLVPVHGALAAAWAAAGAETVLFGAAALAVARRTGAGVMPPVQMLLFVAAALVVGALTVPVSSEWTLLLGILLGIACGPILLPRRARPEEA